MTENYKEKCHVKKECNTTVNVLTPSLPIHLQRKSKCSTAKCQQEDFWGGGAGEGEERGRGAGAFILFCREAASGSLRTGDYRYQNTIMP